MTPEIWGTVATILLVIAAVTSGIGLFRVQRPWVTVAALARATGAASAAIALALAVLAQGAWSPAEMRPEMLSLVLAMLCIQMIFSWQLGIRSTGPVSDLGAVALILLGLFVNWPASQPPTCAQRSVAFGAQWVLFLLGSGSILVAGSASLMLALRKGLFTWGKRPRLPAHEELYSLLAQASSLALVALGSGLIVSMWWAWRTMGTLASGDPREVWLAIAWLAAAMSQLAWHLEGHRGRWVAGLAFVAASCVVFCLVSLAQIQSLLGI